ncbi:YkoP family protein [Deinococcus altitudinis]|uniref:YkoP family protein n=1 Tax=Deinococcus altitudinis TaxID=468914 RepID=UPI003892BB82
MLPPARSPFTRCALLLGAAVWALWKAPGLLQGLAQFGVLREGQGGQVANGLSLRVVQAPDPDVLDALEGTPVTLFLAPPQISQAAALRAAGHELGLLAASSRTLKTDRDRLEAHTGAPVDLVSVDRYHPLTLPRIRRAGLRAVWGGPTGGVAELLDLAEPGGLLDLSGLNAGQISTLLTELRSRGYQPGPIGRLKGLRGETLRGLLQRLYRRFIDARFDRNHQSVALTQRPRALFRISRRPYEGPPLTLPDGRQFVTGAPAAELHIYSKRLVALAELSALTGLRGVQNSLHDVATALQEREDFQDVQFIYALTIFGGVLGAMGFRTEPLPDRRQARIMAVFFNLLRVLYGAKNTDSQVLLPAVIWMDRDALVARYGQPPRKAGAAGSSR